MANVNKDGKILHLFGAVTDPFAAGVSITRAAIRRTWRASAPFSRSGRSSNWRRNSTLSSAQWVWRGIPATPRQKRAWRWPATSVRGSESRSSRRRSRPLPGSPRPPHRLRPGGCRRCGSAATIRWSWPSIRLSRRRGRRASPSSATPPPTFRWVPLSVWGGLPRGRPPYWRTGGQGSPGESLPRSLWKTACPATGDQPRRAQRAARVLDPNADVLAEAAILIDDSGHTVRSPAGTPARPQGHQPPPHPQRRRRSGRFSSSTMRIRSTQRIRTPGSLPNSSRWACRRAGLRACAPLRARRHGGLERDC